MAGTMTTAATTWVSASTNLVPTGGVGDCVGHDRQRGQREGDRRCRKGDHQQAQHEFLRAAALTGNNRERTVMLERAACCAAQHN